MSLKVTAEAELEQQAAFADEMANLLIDKHQKLSAQIVDLLESGWEGEGADACQAAWSEWNKGFRLMIDDLADEAQVLRLAASSYRGITTTSTPSHALTRTSTLCIEGCDVRCIPRRMIACLEPVQDESRLMAASPLR
ncbi:WXG100 family type VII secretion target [Mycobacteroides abscessus]|uniref:WXG100 family type VII secretion target n=1 Tax=Mycobacteroides abscessus TaxID=36809 RepID=UPI0009260A36|nr:WXG100 family type VII secretion target [Mycobacteroides abscessus]UEA49308.1 WXG100 family type VII secretion target [Mycobacteroides abscessus subsp. abscessus]UEA54885.1 WXG100 family type VII secretion target [Mycobacteroides abscessus]SHR17252.1 WXG100 family type VII secretion target [Mycobacteroides abscessus subsp. bolletii]SHS69687.1 WXG100 family type VII secretion target [Mycobacteroides abscessus subsp. bolletii]SHS90886.1 WXG100 family type VII secretion target [Mycobacteroides